MKNQHDTLSYKTVNERKAGIVIQIYQYTNPMNTMLPSPDSPTMKNIDTLY